MKIKIMTKDAIEYCKQNINSEELVRHYVKGDKPEVWMSKEIGKPAFIETEFDIELPTLALNSSDNNVEAENSKLLFYALSDLNSCVTFDERFWSGLSHTFYYDFVRKTITNMSSKNNKINSKTIKEHFFFPTVRSQIQPGTIPRLWTLGKTYCRKGAIKPDKYIEQIAERDWTIHTLRMHTINAFNNPIVVETFLDCEAEFEKRTGKRYSRDMILELTQYTNAFFQNNELPDTSLKKILFDKLMKKAETLLKSTKTVGLNYNEILVNILNTSNGYNTEEKIIEEIEKKFSDKKIKEIVLKNIKNEFTKTNSKYISRINFDGNKYILLNNNFLNKISKDAKNQFVSEIIKNISNDSRILYNTLKTFSRQTISREQIESYKMILEKVNNKLDFEKMLKNGSKELADIGIITITENIFKINV